MIPEELMDELDAMHCCYGDDLECLVQRPECQDYSDLCRRFLSVSDLDERDTVKLKCLGRVQGTAAKDKR